MLNYLFLFVIMYAFNNCKKTLSLAFGSVDKAELMEMDEEKVFKIVQNATSKYKVS